MTTLLGEDEFLHQYISVHKQWEHNRSTEETKNVYAFSIGQIEKQLEALQASESDFTVPVNLTQMDAYSMAKGTDAAKAKLIPLIQHHEAIMDRVRQTVHDFLVATEKESHEGQRTATIFERGQEYVRKALNVRAPEA
uniref:hypothetical protein n=1 Tax=Arthrobacter sp. TaxID=1667 RepID=UPI000EB66A1E|nr:hypothetical protein [Arthrobacter sp.]AXV46407.1 hypothetical protein pA40H2_p52 [Arthrobacter sp.]